MCPRRPCPIMACQEAKEELPSVPASVQTVYCVLLEGDRMTMKDLQGASGLARRTVYGAVRRLRELGMVQEAPNLHDTRQSWIRLLA